MGTNALNQGLLAEMRPTPRNKLMGLLADALTAANDYANKPNPVMPGGLANPVLGLLASGSNLPSLATTAQRMSYGEPLTNKGKANVPFLKPETADVAMMAPIAPRNALAALGMMGGGVSGMERAALDVPGLLSTLKGHQAKLDTEAADWAARKYKGNQRAVFFEGDGPGPESMKIGSINEGRRNKNVQSRMDQMAEIDAVMEMVKRDPVKVEAAYKRAVELAKFDAEFRGWPLEDTLDAYVGKAFTGTQNHVSGPNSIGRQLRMAIESGIVKPQAPAVPPASTSGGDDFLTQLFGN